MRKNIKTALILLILSAAVFSFNSCSLFSKSVDTNLTIEKLD